LTVLAVTLLALCLPLASSPAEPPDLDSCRRSPFFIDVEDVQRDLIDPAVKGTRNVLGAAAKAKGTVRRVVLTSSVAGAPLTKRHHSVQHCSASCAAVRAGCSHVACVSQQYYMRTCLRKHPDHVHPDRPMPWAFLCDTLVSG